MNPQSGFTLIEALAAGLISTIVAGAMLSVLSMTNNQIKESSANLSLGQIQTVVSEQLRGDARKAFGPKAAGEAPNAAFDANPDDDAAVPNTLGVVFCDRTGVSFSRYRINAVDGILEEWDTAVNDYSPFRVGNQVVHLDPVNSSIGILSGRSGITFKIACRIHTDKDYTFPLIEETIRCRNN